MCRDDLHYSNMLPLWVSQLNDIVMYRGLDNGFHWNISFVENRILFAPKRILHLNKNDSENDLNFEDMLRVSFNAVWYILKFH